MNSKRSHFTSEARIKTYGNTYALTIIRHQKLDYVDKSDLDAVITELKIRLNTMNVLLYAYENSGKYRQLHFHGTVKVNEYIKFKELASINGFFVSFKKLATATDRLKWDAYITKEDFNKYEREQTLIINYYNHNYGFR